MPDLFHINMANTGDPPKLFAILRFEGGLETIVRLRALASRNSGDLFTSRGSSNHLLSESQSLGKPAR
jgi:hypothetical protein